VVPILSILSALVLPIALFWHAKLRAKAFYTKVKSNPSHILVTGALGDVEIVKLQDNIIRYRLVDYKY
jgi:hypothetical protein